MKRVLFFALLTGCPSERAALPDSTIVPADAAAGEVLPDRQVNNVIVGQTLTFWSHGQFICSLEFGCPTGPTITAFHSPLKAVSTWVDGGVGTWQIAGSEAELFYVNGTDNQAMYLQRIGGAGTAALSIPRPNLMGPAVDDASVYWAEGNESQVGYAIRRASRGGDGTDAATLAMSSWGTERLTYADGHLWWIELGTSWLTRVPVTGGTPQRVLDNVIAMTASDDVVYVGRSTYDGTGGYWLTEIGRLSADVPYSVVASHVPAGGAPRYLVADSDLVFWSTWDGNLYFAPQAGGGVGTIAADDKAGFAFAVLPDRFLVEFSRYGFRTITR